MTIIDTVVRNVHYRPPEAAAAEVDELRQVGLSMRKAEYIKGIGKARFFVRSPLNFILPFGKLVPWLLIAQNF